MTDNMELEQKQEELLCGSVLRGGSEIYKLARDIVNPDDFRMQTLKSLWRSFENLYEAGIKIDVFTVGDQLERMGVMHDFSSGPWHGSVYLANIRGEGVPGNVLSYAENVADYASKRNLSQLFKQGLSWAENGRRARDIVADTLSALSKVTVYSSQDEWTVPISSALSEAYDWSVRAGAGESVGVPTGFIDLDKLLGSLINGNVYIIAGRPSQGKTSFLVSIIRHVASKGKRVGIFSLEMSRMQVGQRLLAQEAKIDLQKIVKGTMDQDEWNRFNAAIETLEASGIVINDLTSININQIRQTTRNIQNSGGLDLMILDYIQLASGASKKPERRELEVSEVSRGLKYIARELNVPVFAAAQLSRAVEQRSDKRPILSDLRESGSLEQDAFAVMFIHRSDDPAKQNITEIILAKHRNGPVGSVELVFKPEHAQFHSAARL